MKVCICNNFNCKTVKELKEKVTDHLLVHETLGCKIKCGRCLDTIKQILDEKPLLF